MFYVLCFKYHIKETGSVCIFSPLRYRRYRIFESFYEYVHTYTWYPGTVPGGTTVRLIYIYIYDMAFVCDGLEHKTQSDAARYKSGSEKPARSCTGNRFVRRMLRTLILREHDGQ